jgi:hypothetical protein
MLFGQPRREVIVRIRLFALFLLPAAAVTPALIGAPPAAAQAVGRSDTVGQPAAVALAERAAVRALGFTQGDARSFTASRPDFADTAWAAFQKQFAGFLDAQGAPQFSSRFTPAGRAVLVGAEGGVARVRIPGELVQSTPAGKTTYRVAVDVALGGTPRKIRQLTWKTCAGEAARRYCM